MDSSTQSIPTNPPDCTACTEHSEEELADTIAKLKSTRRVIRRIPKGARILTADALTTLISTATRERSASAWCKLLKFPLLALSVPPRSDPASEELSLTTKIKRQVSLYMETGGAVPVPTDTPATARGRRRQQPAGEGLRKRVAAKLSDGDVKGALRILTSSDDLASPSEETIACLKLKHPEAPDNLNLPPCPDEEVELPVQAFGGDIIAAISSFNPGSSGGLDGLRPAHLKDLTSKAAGEGGVRLISALTALVNQALLGEVPAAVRECFYTASLTALRKTDGGIRPIAVGSVYRRLATKVALKPLAAELGKQLRPVQLGYGTPGGCEAAVHASRLFLQGLKENEVLVKLDMKNAFNAVRRDTFLRAVRTRVPSLYRLMWQAYSVSNPIYFGTAKVESSTSLQQGDPAGPAVFSLAIDAVIRESTAAFNSWYLDDGAIGGDAHSVCCDLQRIIPALSKIGLDVNGAKCEILLSKSTPAHQKQTYISALHQHLPGAAVDPTPVMLGAPLTATAAEIVMSEKREDLQRMINRLQDVDAHSAFFLLKNCLAIPKLQHVLRASPVYRQADILKPIDITLQSAMTAITNVKFQAENWQQAVLPARYGGLGLRRTEDIALPSFVASLHHCLELVASMLPERLHAALRAEQETAIASWRLSTDQAEPPAGDAARSQRAWDSAVAEKSRNALLASANQLDHARLLAAGTAESGAWLHAMPSATLGTLLDPETLRVAVALRVGAFVCEPHRCRCGTLADARGHHALTCRFSAGRHPRHTALNDVVRRALQTAGFTSILEPTGIDRGDGKRPDGLTIFPFVDGKSLVWDATCVNTYAASHLPAAAVIAGAAAKEAEVMKTRKYSELATRYRFQPVAFETSGTCGPSTRVFIRQLGARLTSLTGEPRESAWLWQRLAIAVIRGNAVSVRFAPTETEQRANIHGKRNKPLQEFVPRIGFNVRNGDQPDTEQGEILLQQAETRLKELQRSEREQRVLEGQKVNFKAENATPQGVLAVPEPAGAAASAELDGCVSWEEV